MSLKSFALEVGFSDYCVFRLPLLFLILQDRLSRWSSVSWEFGSVGDNRLSWRLCRARIACLHIFYCNVVFSWLRVFVIWSLTRGFQILLNPLSLELFSLLLWTVGFLQRQPKRDPAGNGINEKQVNTIEDTTDNNEANVEIQMCWLTLHLVFEFL